MSLLEEQMAERRARILAAARRLITRGGFEGLTMRELAEAARVSVPTVYNLIGNKYLLLDALVQEQFAEARTLIAKVPQGLSVVDAIEIMPGIAHDVLLANPGYSQALIQVFLTAEDSGPTRRAADAQSMALMAASVRAGQQKGELCTWADAELVARTMYSIYVSALIRWGRGEIEEAELRVSTRLGMALVLLGLSRGEARERLEQRVREQQALARELAAAPEKGA